MTLNCYKFKCSRNLGLHSAWSALGILFNDSALYKCSLNNNNNNNNNNSPHFGLPIYQGCRALTFALAKLSCL